MALRTTVVAECDAWMGPTRPYCLATISLDPSSTQHFRDLSDKSWSWKVDDEGDRILTFCPDHREEAK